MSEPKCICPYVGSTWHEGPMVREYHQEQDPNCPVHAGCTCPPHLDGIGLEKWPDCPIHSLRQEPRDRPYEITLDEDERRGH